ncbi:hypothetical protein BC628DRAFT_1418329 [Trametes gibbosa]|nr:hypothetical protein BC628DRAFT_1418329 [Trametes gibbosa]
MPSTSNQERAMAVVPTNSPAPPISNRSQSPVQHPSIHITIPNAHADVRFPIHQLTFGHGHGGFVVPNHTSGTPLCDSPRSFAGTAAVPPTYGQGAHSSCVLSPVIVHSPMTPTTPVSCRRASRRSGLFSTTDDGGSDEQAGDGRTAERQSGRASYASAFALADHPEEEEGARSDLESDAHGNLAHPSDLPSSAHASAGAGSNDGALAMAMSS